MEKISYLCSQYDNNRTLKMIQQIAKDNEGVTPISREMEGLKEYFPQCFNQQGEFDIDKFREAIQPQVDVTREGRSYDFLGKSYARMLSSLDTTTVIRPDTEHNSKPENANSENIYISGDNLDALHHLVKSYAGQVKCIYIDPPYNTGTDGFVYNDKFKFTAEELEKKLSISPEVAEKTIDGVDCGLVKLKATGTTGYEVYYLQLIVDWPHNIRPKQAFVIRILKQLRGCKVLSFGNPVLVYNFLGKRENVCEPNRATSNTEIFKKILLNTLEHVTSRKIINWAAKEMDAPLTEKSFGIILNPSATYTEKKPAGTVKKIEKEIKTLTTNDKKELVHKALKQIIADKKKEKESNYMTIYPYDIYEKIKNAEKIWGNEEKFAEDLSWHSLCYMDIPKYIQKVDEVDPWGGNKYVSCIKYIMKQCKEFDSLNLYIKNVLKCKELGMEDVKKEDISGKRSSIFERWGTKLLAHSPETCKNIKAWCQKNKAGNWHGEIEKKHYTYWGDRFNSYGEDMEFEWNGYEDDYIIIRLVTPAGKVKVQQEFHVY